MTETVSTRRPRADALRNRQLIIEAAAEAFREHGLEVSVAEIARRAGVGSGTLFRNFPTKQDLIRAILEARITRWQEVIEEALANPDVESAFGTFIDEVLYFGYYDRGQMEAFKERLLDDPELLECKNEAFGLTEALLQRARDAGLLRADISTDDFYSLTSGLTEAAKMSSASDVDSGDKPYLRYREILLSGLRPPA